MVARFSRCIVVTHWLPHTLVQIVFCLILVHKKVWCVLVHKKVWCSLSSLSIQTGALTVTSHITLMSIKLG